MPADLDDFVAAARALDAAFVRHLNAGDLERLVAACYTEDALVLPPNLPLVRGRGQIRELFREMLEAGGGNLTRETTPLHVDGSLGYGVGGFTFSTDHRGSEPVYQTGKHLLVYRRQADGTWKVAVDMFSSNLPAP
jgi:ketosteroid isomerase-like protein